MDHGETPDAVHIARLLRLAGPRPQMSLDSRVRVEHRVHEEWAGTLRRRVRARRVLVGAATLAAAALLAAVFRVAPETPAAARRVARVELVRGAARALRGEQPRPVSAGEELVAGDRLVTSEGGRLALRWNGGPSVRLDVATRVELVTVEALNLERGAVYLDADGRSDTSGGLAVVTRWGAVRDVGTRFEVRVGDSLRIRVREGWVSVEAPGLSERAEAGEELSVDETGELRRGSIPRFGPQWDWVLDVAPSFDLDRHPLGSYLDWVAREAGLVVCFDDSSLENSVRATVVQGSVRGLTPLQSLEVVLPAAGLGHRIEHGELRIREAP